MENVREGIDIVNGDRHSNIVNGLPSVTLVS